MVIMCNWCCLFRKDNKFYKSKSYGDGPWLRFSVLILAVFFAYFITEVQCFMRREEKEIITIKFI